MVADPHAQRQRDSKRKQNSVPQNPRLWAMLQIQAKAKFKTYPSIPASRWVHNEYVQRGGTFVASKKEDTRHNKSGQETGSGKKEREQEDSKKGAKGGDGKKRG